MGKQDSSDGIVGAETGYGEMTCSQQWPVSQRYVPLPGCATVTHPTALIRIRSPDNDLSYLRIHTVINTRGRCCDLMYNVES